jgi:sugar phosphate isomerase/epimerase
MKISRRKFLSTSALVTAGVYTASAHKYFAASAKTSFSTLGCPDWPFDKIVSFAKEHNYNGIELRGILRQMDLPLVPEFTDENLQNTKKLMKKNGQRFVNLGSSATMHIRDDADRRKNLDDGKRFIDLAQKMDCPYVRLFPNNLLTDESKETTLARISEGIHQLAEYAKAKDVAVLMETHGDLVHADDVVNVMQQVNHPNAGLIWDVTNMFAIAKEPVKEVFEKIKPWIKHTHIKDAKLVDGKINYVLLGDGDIPIFEAVDLLKANGYKGFYSFEWEKLWHPELAEPDEPFADYSNKLHQRLQ